MSDPRAPLPSSFASPGEAVRKLFEDLGEGASILVVEDSEQDQLLFRRYFGERKGKEGIHFDFAPLVDIGEVDIDAVIERIQNRQDIWAIVLDLSLSADEEEVYRRLRDARTIVEAWASFDKENLDQSLSAFRILKAAREVERHLPVAIATKYARHDGLVRILNLYGVVGVVLKAEAQWMSELDLFLLQAHYEVERDRLTSEFLLVGQLVSHGAKNLLLESFAKLEDLERSGKPPAVQDLEQVKDRLSTLQARLHWHLDEIPRVVSATRRRGGPIRSFIEIVGQVRDILTAPYKAWAPYARNLGVQASPGALGVYTYPLLLLLTIEEIVLNVQRHLEASWQPGKSPYLVWAEIKPTAEGVTIAICHDGPPSTVGGEELAGVPGATRLGLPLLHRAAPLLGASLHIEAQQTLLSLPRHLSSQ